MDNSQDLFIDGPLDDIEVARATIRWLDTPLTSAEFEEAKLFAGALASSPVLRFLTPQEVAIIHRWLIVDQFGFFVESDDPNFAKQVLRNPEPWVKALCLAHIFPDDWWD